MTPQKFPEAITTYGPPIGFADSQVVPVPAWHGQATGGSCDGQMMTVVAWKPNEAELEHIRNGALIYLTMFGGLAPHMLTTGFHQATHPA